MLSKTPSRFTMEPLLLSHGEYFHLAPSKTMLTGPFLDRTEECSLFFPPLPLVLIREETGADLGIGQSWNRSPTLHLLHSNLGKSKVTWNLGYDAG